MWIGGPKGEAIFDTWGRGSPDDIYSSKKVKDHNCVAVFWKSSPTDFVNIEEQCLLMRLISFLRKWLEKERFQDCCAQKRDMLCGASLLVILGWGLLWLFYWLVPHPWRFDRVPLSRYDQWGICDPYTGVGTRTLWLRLCRACCVNKYTERETNGLAWPCSPINLTKQVWDILPSSRPA